MSLEKQMSDLILTVVEEHVVLIKKEKHIDGGYLVEQGLTEDEIMEYIESGEALEEDTELLQGDYDGMLKSEAIFEILTDAEPMDVYEDWFSDRKGGTEYHFEIGGLK